VTRGVQKNAATVAPIAPGSDQCNAGTHDRQTTGGLAPSTLGNRLLTCSPGQECRQMPTLVCFLLQRPEPSLREDLPRLHRRFCLSARPAARIFCAAFLVTIVDRLTRRTCPSADLHRQFIEAGARSYCMSCSTLASVTLGGACGPWRSHFSPMIRMNCAQPASLTAAGYSLVCEHPCDCLRSSTWITWFSRTNAKGLLVVIVTTRARRDLAVLDSDLAPGLVSVIRPPLATRLLSVKPR